MKILELYILISYLFISGNLSTENSLRKPGNSGAAGQLPFPPGYYTTGENCSSSQDAGSNNLQATLPVVITPAKSFVKDAPAAFFISGDGGWYKFEQSIADKLAELGVGTVGFDTKKYFWNRRTPEETTSGINACLEHYGNEWKKEKFIIIGYSLGAEIIPFVINRFSGQVKSKISMMVLLSPQETTDFQVHIVDMLGISNRKNTYLVIDEIRKIQNIPSLLIYGADEKSKVPALFRGTPVMIDIIPGDHHYKFNTSLIVQTMKNHKAF